MLYTHQLPEYGVLVAPDGKTETDLTPADAMVVRARLTRPLSRESVVDCLARPLQFPEPYGRNWDAFHESLRDLQWLSWQCLVLLVEDADLLLELEALQVVIFLKLLSNSAAFWKWSGKSFTTILAGGDKLDHLVYRVLADWHVKDVP